jgi:hypothetical protein
MLAIKSANAVEASELAQPPPVVVAGEVAARMINSTSRSSDQRCWAIADQCPCSNSAMARAATVRTSACAPRDRSAAGSGRNGIGVGLFMPPIMHPRWRAGVTT